MPSCVDSDCGASTWRQHKLSSSQLTGRLMIQLLCMCVYVCVRERVSVCVRPDMDTTGAHCWNRTRCGVTVTAGGLQPSDKTSSTAALMWYIPPPPLHHHHQPCPRAWRRGSTTGPTKSVRASFAGMRRGSWGWSWRAARRMDSSRSSASFSRAERRATAANSSRMNSCWKSTTPRWPDSPPGTSTLWSNTAKTRSDSSVSNKVTFLFSRISFIFVLNR